MGVQEGEKYSPKNKTYYWKKMIKTGTK